MGGALSAPGGMPGARSRARARARAGQEEATAQLDIASEVKVACISAWAPGASPARANARSKGNASSGVLPVAAAGGAAAAAQIHVPGHLVRALLLRPLLLIEADAHAADEAGVEVDRVQLVVAVRVQRVQHLLDFRRALLGADHPGDVLQVVKRDRARGVVIEELENAHDVVDRVLGGQLRGHALEELVEVELLGAQQRGDVFIHLDAQRHRGALQLLRIDEAAAVLVDHVEGALHV
mmetsp:Transcript_28278/g.80385  ORF Transcript_28278/g.80385 Transcript_28278/m.80385 type:complete len:238 (-) Transcript_28278:663-1376(-)